MVPPVPGLGCRVSPVHLPSEEAERKYGCPIALSLDLFLPLIPPPYGHLACVVRAHPQGRRFSKGDFIVRLGWAKQTLLNPQTTVVALGHVIEVGVDGNNKKNHAHVAMQ